MDFNYELDKEDMKSVLLDFKNQIEKAKKLSEGIKVEGEFNHIFILGMGGSAQPGDLLKCYLDESKRPITIVKNYHVPKFMNNHSLVFVISYSGNTEETVSSYREAMKTGAKIVVISSGGKLEEIAKMNKDIFIKVPKGLEPRQGIGYLFFPMLFILKQSGIVKNIESDLENTKAILSKDFYQKKGQELAIRLQNKIPVIYSSENMSIVAEKWKITLNENAKTPAFYNVFPEMNHNEMNGFLNVYGDYYIIFIKDENDNPRIQKRMDITKKIISEQNIEVIEMVIKGNSKLAKIFSSIHLADWVAYYLALLYGIDPSPVDMVENLKKELNK